MTSDCKKCIICDEAFYWWYDNYFKNCDKCGGERITLFVAGNIYCLHLLIDEKVKISY